MELCLCATTRRGCASKVGNTIIFTDGMGRVTADFCAASETARDVAVQYTETPVGSLKDHKFVNYAMSGEQVQGVRKK
jgi:hypothetical protein